MSFSSCEILLLFFSGFLTEILYVLWMRSMTIGKIWRACLISMLMATFSMLGFTVVSHDPLLIAPYVLGVGIGFVVGVKLSGQL